MLIIVGTIFQFHWDNLIATRRKEVNEKFEKEPKMTKKSSQIMTIL